MTVDTKETIVFIEVYIGSSSSRTTIDHLNYYLGTTMSILISVRDQPLAYVSVVVTQPVH